MIGSPASKAASLAVAKAIRNSRKFNVKEHEAASAEIAELMAKHPDWIAELSQYLVKIGNVSATAKELAKAGLVNEGDPSALAREIAEQVDFLAESLKAEMEKTTAGKR